MQHAKSGSSASTHLACLHCVLHCVLQEHKGDVWDDINVLAVMAGSASEDLRYLKSVSLHLWLFGYEVTGERGGGGLFAASGGGPDLGSVDTRCRVLTHQPQLHAYGGGEGEAAGLASLGPPLSAICPDMCLSVCTPK